jgi:hypothetical protein
MEVNPRATKNFDLVLQSTLRVFLVFFLLLSQFFCKDALTIAMQHGLVPVFAKFRSYVRLIGVKSKHSKGLLKRLSENRHQQ